MRAGPQMPHIAASQERPSLLPPSAPRLPHWSAATATMAAIPPPAPGASHAPSTPLPPPGPPILANSLAPSSILSLQSTSPKASDGKPRARPATAPSKLGLDGGEPPPGTDGVGRVGSQEIDGGEPERGKDGGGDAQMRIDVGGGKRPQSKKPNGSSLVPTIIKVRVGTLVPFAQGKSGPSNASLLSIPIFEGSNVVGRSNLVVVDKRVSRKHLSLRALADGSVEVVVEGPNPIVVRSDGQARKVCAQGRAKIIYDDVLELIPGDYLMKYVAMSDERKSSASVDSNDLKKGKRHSEEDSVVAKRNRQVMEDEALARTLQESFAEEGTSVPGMACGQALSSLDSAGSSERNNKRTHSAGPLKDVLPLTFRLMRVQGLPSWTNSSAVTIQDVIQGDVLFAVLSNYMVDIDWLLTACPSLRKVPHVLVLHGEDGASLEHLKKSKPANWILHKPPLPISFGTHHSKAMLLVYPQGIRVVVHTANLIHVDWNNKSQGLWTQDFPWKDANDMNTNISFENDLVDYLRALKWPEFRLNLPVAGDVNINAAFFRKFDYSSSTVRLIGSVPGYHVGPNMKRWGHMKLRSVLEECVFEKQFCKSPLIYQFSSLGSLDEKWMSEFACSLSAGKAEDGSPLGIGKPLIVWPTVEDVRCSIEGYAAGSCIPSPQKNVEKDFLRKYWSRWKADHVGRCT
ncbi:tyrosyl-DNA phosphodiesterase 1 isoform X3 [Lolium perenne]|uniref:tyrosyl-DNA phosphodiesterase 1 isoform X3 n=1 Tax=Lolium perenne TaxID=4522 RepID=UPI0021F65022|nr:tyrosyl-DNA phosphodiesterase 1-like isoform X3 [Lolium perenne]